MTNYLKLIIFPSKALENLDAEKSKTLYLYLILTGAFLVLMIPKFFAIQMNSPKALVQMTGYILSIPLAYLIITYCFGYLFWIISKGFNGLSSLVQMRTLLGYSLVPLTLKAIVLIPFIVIGIVKNNMELITHDNYLSSLIIGLLGFRILIVGIARYNKFNWMITIIIWFLVTSFLGVLAYFLKMLN